jgi:glycosyltransferase involved in cell wall biosynthesis
MNIAIISKLWEETSPFSVGGTGVAVGILADELVKRGHTVTLFATGDSKTKAHLVSVREKPWGNQYSEPIEYLHISEAFSSKYHFDIIDCHVEEKACFFADAVKTPTLINVTYGEFGDEKKVFERYKHLNYVAISHALKKVLPLINWVDVIYHGIDVNQFPYNEHPKDYLLFLGRVSPQKAPHIAINVAKKLGKKLIIAGKMADADKAYLEEKVLPYIDGKQIQYFGVAHFEQKKELYKNAVAFLHPLDYVEAFGLTLIEALACGTPVIAYDKGAPSEIIVDRKTGFIVNNEQEMIDAVQAVSTISRRVCREHVEMTFTVEKMVDQYELLYTKIITQRS